jgi:hypothetical protein
MAAPATPQSVMVMVGIGALVAWRMYSRIRRMVGKQKYSPMRARVTVTIFPLLFALLAVFAAAHPVAALSLLGGAGLGSLLGIYGLRLTKFEQTPQGLYYTPNAHLGVALSVALIVRIGFRLVQVAYMTPTDSPPPNAFLSSPFTLAIFGTLAAYYVTYAIGLIRWEREMARNPLPSQPTEIAQEIRSSDPS